MNAITILPSTVYGFRFVVTAQLASGPYECVGYAQTRAAALAGAEAHLARLGRAADEVRSVRKGGRAA